MKEYGEILQELRVGQTVVQILFGVLLTMPMQQRFSRFDDVQRYLLVVDLAISRRAAVFWAVTAGVFITVLWVVLPVTRRAREGDAAGRSCPDADVGERQRQAPRSTPVKVNWLRSSVIEVFWYGE